MSLTRETVYAALFTLLKTVQYTPPGGAAPIALPTYSRRFTAWEKVDPVVQPALYLTQGNEFHRTDSPGLGDRIVLRPHVWVYVNVPGDADVPGTVLNPILDQIQNLFPAPGATEPMSGVQQLGGLVKHVLIGGEVLSFEGLLGQQEVAMIPLDVLYIN